MQLYRFLFAPVLLAAAVLSGHQQKPPAPMAERPAITQPSAIPDRYRRQPAAPEVRPASLATPGHARPGR